MKEDKSAIICIHVLSDPVKLGIREEFEPIDERDSGLIYHCADCLPGESMDNWRTVCLECALNSHAMIN